LLAAVGFTDAAQAGPALVAIGLGGLAGSWLSGAVARAHRRRLVTVGAAALAAALVAAVAYLALAHGDLLDLVATSLAAGPDAH
jgi:predicted MFS family arabinose efflux permease